MRVGFLLGEQRDMKQVGKSLSRTEGFLNSSTMNLGHAILCLGEVAVLCTVGCVAVSLPLHTRCKQQRPVVTTKNVSRHYEISRGESCSQLRRTTDVD